ncbi:hypothetical protein Gogos_011977, partial [Gossypium gossypioides]|nr:hypothetical protein [Gossypium gossypioides]
WITWVLEQLNPCQSRLFYCALWAIWGDRNRRIHEGKVSNGKEIANFTSNYITELTGFEKRKSANIIENKRWQHPHREFIKINFDGAYNESQYCSASGIVARDAEGRVLLSYSEIQSDITSVFAIEAIACWRAVQIGVDRGWQSVIFEGDSLAVIKKCNTKGQDRSMIGVYIHDIQQKISEFNNISFQHTPRSANNLAHILATETLRRKEEVYLEMEVPEYAKDQRRYDRLREPD